jgi:hypothetical protein
MHIEPPTIGPKRFDVLACTRGFGRMQNGDRLLPACVQSELLILEASPPHIEILCSNSDSVLIPRARDSSLVDVACVRELIQRVGRLLSQLCSVPSSSRPPTFAAEPLHIAAAALQSRVKLGVSSSANHPLSLPSESGGALPSHNVIRNEHVVLILTEAHSESSFCRSLQFGPKSARISAASFSPSICKRLQHLT